MAKRRVERETGFVERNGLLVPKKFIELRSQQLEIEDIIPISERDKLRDVPLGEIKRSKEQLIQVFQANKRNFINGLSDSTYESKLKSEAKVLLANYLRGNKILPDEARGAGFMERVLAWVNEKFKENCIKDLENNFDIELFDTFSLHIHGLKNEEVKKYLSKVLNFKIYFMRRDKNPDSFLKSLKETVDTVQNYNGIIDVLYEASLDIPHIENIMRMIDKIKVFLQNYIQKNGITGFESFITDGKYIPWNSSIKMTDVIQLRKIDKIPGTDLLIHTFPAIGNISLELYGGHSKVNIYEQGRVKLNKYTYYLDKHGNYIPYSGRFSHPLVQVSNTPLAGIDSDLGHRYLDTHSEWNGIEEVETAFLSGEYYS